MKMSTNYELMDEYNVVPTAGLAVDRGLVKIVAVTCWDGLPTYVDGEAYLIEDESFDTEIKAGAWYGLRYLDEKLHSHYGVMYIPETLFQEVIRRDVQEFLNKDA